MKCRVYLLFFLLVLSTHVCANQFYIGGGISSIRLNIDHPSVNSQTGAGYHVFAGTKYERWAIELAASGGLSFTTGETPGIYYPEDSAEYGNLVLGLRRYFSQANSSELMPWLGVGLGLHFITWDTFYYNVDGYGLSISGGADYLITPDWFIRGGVYYNDFRSDDTYEYGPYDGRASQLNIVLGYLF